jgi:hypothetical protein
MDYVGIRRRLGGKQAGPHRETAMSGTGDYKTNYFGTFLETLNAPDASPAPGASLPAASIGADTLMRKLKEHGGSAEFKDLLPLTDYSIDKLAQTVKTLNLLGLVESAGSKVMMTPAGRDVALKSSR